MALIIYHDNCFDGFGAAWVATKALGRLEDVGGGLWPSKYGDEPPPDHILENLDVYLLDFSYPRTVMESLPSKCKSVVCLDHHKTAQANCEGLDWCTFDMERSGAGLTWDHFYPDRPYPNLIKYVQDRDLWKFECLESRAVHAYLESFNKDFHTWDTLANEFDHHLERAILGGNTILRFQQQKVKEMAGEMRIVDVGGYSVPVVNCPYNFGSLVGEYLNQHYPDYPFSAYYFDRQDGEQQWGLRSRGFDVSEVAKQFGGGGHQKAAGFVKGKRTRE